MKIITLYKPNGDIFRCYRNITSADTSDGSLSFRYEHKPDDRNSVLKVVTNLPYVVEDDLEP